MTRFKCLVSFSRTSNYHLELLHKVFQVLFIPTVNEFGQKYDIVLDNCQMVTCKVAEAILRGVRRKELEAGVSKGVTYGQEAFQESSRIQTRIAVLGMSALGI